MDLMIALVTISLIGFVLYTIYTTPASTGCLSADANREKAAAAAVSAPKPVQSAPAAAPKPAATVVSAPAVQKPVAKPVAPVAKAAPPAKPASTASKPAPVASAPKPASVAASKSAEVTIRNPATGEKATVPANYRFAKKWIKDALVAEGLLDKVYKNNELDDAAGKKAKAALDKLKTLTKYHA